MTEQEWLACTKPDKLLGFLLNSSASERRLRLFAVACCRQICTLPDERSQQAVELWHFGGSEIFWPDRIRRIKELRR
jgi:hypothetical protein